MRGASLSRPMTGLVPWSLQLLGLAALGWLAWQVLVQWAWVNAVFHPDPQACRALEHRGACWGVVAEKWRTWIFGRYPLDQQWRAGAALLLWVTALAWWVRPLWTSRPVPTAAPAPPALSDAPAVPAIHQSGRAGRRAGVALAAGLLGVALLAGGWSGMPRVEPVLWSGLPLTLLLAGAGLSLSLPLALALAWGRLSPRRWLSWPCAAFIEVVRGAPLVMWLFLAAFVLPAVLPEQWGLGPVQRVLIVLVVFSAAYAAEILRGALAVVAAEQAEAGAMLGASWWMVQREVIVPQALRTALPPLVSHAIGLLKDTALVMIVGLQDLTGAMSMSLNGDPEWRPFFLEAYLVIALIYAALCLGVAAVGRRLEARFPALGRQM